MKFYRLHFERAELNSPHHWSFYIPYPLSHLVYPLKHHADEYALTGTTLWLWSEWFPQSSGKECDWQYLLTLAICTTLKIGIAYAFCHLKLKRNSSITASGNIVFPAKTDCFSLKSFPIFSFQNRFHIISWLPSKKTIYK